jgi:hypothetical protein
MRALVNRLHVGLLAGIIVLGAGVSAVPAQVISSPLGTSDVGVDVLGNLYAGGIGFQRNSDLYDPIQPGTPREAYGVSAGSDAGWVDPYYFVDANIVPNGLPVYGANTAFVSTFLVDGFSTNVLRIDQSYQFAAENVLRIDNTVTNVSGSSQAVLYSRHVDWDILPSTFFELVTASPHVPPVIDASYNGFENPNPLAPFALSTGVAGGVFGPGDLGAAALIDLGNIAPGGSQSFSIYHGINLIGQSPALLQAQLVGLGATYVSVVGQDTGSGGPFNSAALGVGVVPEPSAVTVLLVVGGAGLFRRRRR